ncbi:hypothetical protein [Paractinoplanes hotanensis]|uniref:Uncharacterized protein n=1 Tax=Paractinoplanes hotanensis TaxID=2906497 RepID=A0ABT0XZ81_9ACTN|nr:hypothetical protein [Actinoplanes hotanensis]MCM4079104.1 hypothetical protein [Actinoplanes hotanensis]
MQRLTGRILPVQRLTGRILPVQRLTGRILPVQRLTGRRRPDGRRYRTDRYGARAHPGPARPLLSRPTAALWLTAALLVSALLVASRTGPSGTLARPSDNTGRVPGHRPGPSGNRGRPDAFAPRHDRWHNSRAPRRPGAARRGYGKASGVPGSPGAARATPALNTPRGSTTLTGAALTGAIGPTPARTALTGTVRPTPARTDLAGATRTAMTPTGGILIESGRAATALRPAATLRRHVAAATAMRPVLLGEVRCASEGARVTGPPAALPRIRGAVPSGPLTRAVLVATTVAPGDRPAPAAGAGVAGPAARKGLTRSTGHGPPRPSPAVVTGGRAALTKTARLTGNRPTGTAVLARRGPTPAEVRTIRTRHGPPRAAVFTRPGCPPTGVLVAGRTRHRLTGAMPTDVRAVGST